MDLKQMEILLNVVTYQSFSRAAQKLYLTQPTVSAHISSLEKEVGEPLLVRSSKGVYATEKGALLCEYARDMLALRENALAMFHKGGEAQPSVVNIAASTIPSQYVLPVIMADFKRSNPKITFHIQHGDSEDVVRDIQQRKVELGMAGSCIQNEACVYEEFLEDRLVLLTPNTERYRAYGNDFPLEQLQYEAFLMREEGSGTRKETEAFFRSAGFDLKKMVITAEIGDNEAIKHSVRQGLGVAILSETAVRDYESFGMVRVFRLAHPLLLRRLYLVFRRNHQLSAPARAFAEYVKGYYRQQRLPIVRPLRT